MRKIVFCNISMKEELTPLVYSSGQSSLRTCDEPVAYPLLSVLEDCLGAGDSVKVVLLCKCDPQKRYLRNVERFQAEFRERCPGAAGAASFTVLDTEFDEGQDSAGKLLLDIVNACEPGAAIIGDITYGTKSLPVVLLAALGFAMKHLDCKVEHLFYGQVYFQGNQPTEPELRDLSYLLYLNSLIYTLQCASPEKAKQTLEMLLHF